MATPTCRSFVARAMPSRQNVLLPSMMQSPAQMYESRLEDGVPGDFPEGSMIQTVRVARTVCRRDPVAGVAGLAPAAFSAPPTDLGSGQQTIS